MIRGVLLDEHYPDWWPGAIVTAIPWLDVRRIGGPGAPPLGTKDLQILAWLGGQQFILVTDNRSTMPGHLADFNSKGGHIPGVFVAEKEFEIHVLADELEMIVGASLPGEYRDQIRFLPLPELH